MGGRIIDAIGWLLLEFEARMVTLMVWLCWVLGITSDEVEHFRDWQQKKVKTRPATITNNPPVPPEPSQPPQPSATTRRPDHGA